jgi:exodeoxyribonuclease V alpha subunit
MITLSGAIERVVYQHPETHYMIARLRTDEAGSRITVVGYLPGVKPGETVSLTGDWETHDKYGQQFKVQSFDVRFPAHVDGIRKYLKSGIIRGLGAKTVDRLVDHFLDFTLDVLENDPDRILDVPGIGKKTAARIMEAWQERRGIRQFMDFLDEYRISPALGAKILSRYGDDSLSMLKKSPYRVFLDIPDMDFSSMDALAFQMGFAEDHPERITACVEFQLKVFIDEGHTFMPGSLLLEKLEKRYGIPRTTAKRAVEELVDSGFWVEESVEDDTRNFRIFPALLHEAEIAIARRIHALLSIPPPSPSLDEVAMIAELVERVAIVPSPEQMGALRGALFHRMAVITGGPGTGKTTLIRSITALLKKSGKTILLAAPTGRAARRLSEVTLREAETLHKMLRYNLSTGFFDKNQDDPLNADTVIVDEASMMDTVLMEQLINAVSMHSTLILVGDVFQLPSIGPGNVLADLIQCGRVPSFELKTIFRQTRESPIVMAAHQVKEGEMPGLEPFTRESGPGFYFVERDDPWQAAATVVELCAKTFPGQFNLNPFQDVQVITPMHKGVTGTLNLNQVLQKALNPSGNRVQGLKGSRLRKNDKVMHLKNNYQKDVFNGDIGIIQEINNEDRTLTVAFDQRPVSYAFDELEELAPAYAVSVHKAQGSEYPAVVIPLMTEHFILLQRNLLYTAITRGKQLVVVVGSRKALRMAMANNKPGKRLSSLARRLNPEKISNLKFEI